MCLVLPDGRVIPGLPDVLWDWLRVHPYQPVKWITLKRRLQRHLKMWIRGGLRTTAASYYCALHGTDATAALLGQCDSNVARKHLVDPAAHKAAAEFFAIAPATISAKPASPIGANLRYGLPWITSELRASGPAPLF